MMLTLVLMAVGTGAIAVLPGYETLGIAAPILLVVVGVGLSFIPGVPEIRLEPQVVLIGANGQKLIPRLPATGCGLIQSRVLVALDALRWQPVSVHLIAKLDGGAAQTVSGAAPHSIQTVGGQAQ